MVQDDYFKSERAPRSQRPVWSPSILMPLGGPGQRATALLGSAGSQRREPDGASLVLPEGCVTGPLSGSRGISTEPPCRTQIRQISAFLRRPVVTDFAGSSRRWSSTAAPRNTARGTGRGGARNFHLSWTPKSFPRSGREALYQEL